MEIGASKDTKSKKLIMADSSEDEEEGSAMSVDMGTDKLTPHAIGKRKITRRGDIQRMKQEIKNRRKMGDKRAGYKLEKKLHAL